MGLLERIIKRKPRRNKEEGTAIQRYGKSFLHAIDGMIYCLKYEHNMVIIITAIVIVTACGFIFRINESEWLFVLTMFGTISASEYMNSAIEAAIDLETSEILPLAKVSKDVASSATLILCITSIIGGLIIFLPKIINVLGG